MPLHGVTALPPDPQRSAVILLGGLDNLDTLRRKHDAADMTAEQVIERLLDRLPLVRAIEQLRGHFALVLHRPGQLVLISDRMGTLPLYWSHPAPKRLIWSTGMPAGPVDPIGIRQLLMFGATVPPRTARRGVSRLPPGHLLQIDAAGTALERWWRPPVVQGGSGGSLLKWTASTAGAIQVATRSVLPDDEPFGVVLS
ncbi:MAG: hypothetical protein AAFV53_09600, partial [Myxococcota bacterium]